MSQRLYPKMFWHYCLAVRRVITSPGFGWDTAGEYQGIFSIMPQSFSAVSSQTQHCVGGGSSRRAPYSTGCCDFMNANISGLQIHHNRKAMSRRFGLSSGSRPKRADSSSNFIDEKTNWTDCAEGGEFSKTCTATFMARGSDLLGLSGHPCWKYLLQIQ